MSRVKYTAAGISMIAMLAVIFTPHVYAERGSNSDRSSSTDNEVSVETETTDTTETETEHTKLVETKREEIKTRLEALQNDRAEKLSEKRLASCDKKEAKINALIQKRSEQATKHLAVFQKIEKRVTDFIASKNLTVENYDALTAAINDKEAAAQAAIDENKAVVFDCATASDSQPAQIPQTSFETVRDALKAYRTAIKDLIVKVKASAAKTESTTDSTNDTNTESTTTTNTETTTGGAQ